MRRLAFKPLPTVSLRRKDDVGGLAARIKCLDVGVDLGQLAAIDRPSLGHRQVVMKPPGLRPCGRGIRDVLDLPIITVYDDYLFTNQSTYLIVAELPPK